MKRRCVIVGGADIADRRYIKDRCFKDGDYYIFCDSGLRHLEGFGVQPDLVIGDFDSADNPHLDCETIVLPTVKDDTDTSYAVREAIRRGFEEVILVGAAGNRQDHTLVNLYLLFMLDSAGVKGYLEDDYSEMEVVSDKPVYIEDSYIFFSLLNMTGLARGITIKNAKYELEDGEITPDVQYATSNEVIPGKTACVSLKEGRLLLIKVWRER